MCTSNRSTHQYLLPHTVSGWAFGSVCLLVCPHVLYMWGYPTLHCCYLTKKSMVLNKLVDFVSVSGYKWSVCVPCKTLWGEPEWEQTARTELAFTELCWSVSAPYYRCLDHVLAVACPLSIHQFLMSALLLFGPTAEKNHTRCMPCDDLCTCSVSDCLIHNVWSTCGKILSNQ